MTRRSIVFDAGVLGEVAANKEFRAVVAELVERGWDPVIPTPVLAEAITGKATDASTNHLVRRVGTVSTTESTARRAGHLRGRLARTGTRRLPSGIDAIVAGHAADADQAIVFTTDVSDLLRLLADQPSVTVARP